MSALGIYEYGTSTNPKDRLFPTMTNPRSRIISIDGAISLGISCVNWLVIDPAAVRILRTLYTCLSIRCVPSKGKPGVGRPPRREGTRVSYKRSRRRHQWKR